MTYDECFLGNRRMSTENSLIKLDGRLVPNMFKGKETTSVPSGAGPKLGYRSMVSVDDVPELFASLDSKFILFQHQQATNQFFEI